MTSRQNDKEVPRDTVNSSPPKQQARRNTDDNNPPVDEPPMEDNLLQSGVPITDAEILSLPQLENQNNLSLTLLHLEKPPPLSPEINVSSTVPKNTISDSLPKTQTFAPLILPLASRLIPGRDFSELPIPEAPNISPTIMTRFNKPMPSSSSVRRPNKRDASQMGQGVQTRSQNIQRTIKERTTTKSAKFISKPTPVTKAAKSVLKPTESMVKPTSSTTASKSILKPRTQTLVTRSILKPIKTTRAARTVLEPAPITTVARPTPESTSTTGISRTCTVTSHTSTRTSSYLPDIEYTSRAAQNISAIDTKITTKKGFFSEMPCPTKIPRKAIFTSEMCTTTTPDKQHTTTVAKTTRIDPESSQTITTRSSLPNILRRTRVPGTTSMTSSTLNTRSLLRTGSRMQGITERPTMQPRIFSLVLPSTRANTYEVESIIKPLPTSSESPPVTLVLRPKKNDPSTGIIESPSVGSIIYESTPIAETASTVRINRDLVPSRLEPSRSIESSLSLVATTTTTITNQSVSSTQTPMLSSLYFPIRQDPVLRYENRSHVVTSHPQDMPRFLGRTQPDLLHGHLTTCDSPPSRSEPRRLLTKTSRIHITETGGTPTTIASHTSVTEVPLSTQPSAARINIRKIISIRNPHTNRIQEYWIRRNTEMLAQIGGSVNDSISSRLPLNYAAAFRAPVHEVVSRAPMNVIATSRAPINVASTSYGAPRVIVLAQLDQFRKKKTLKGIKRRQAKPVDLESSSSGDPSRPATKIMSPLRKIGIRQMSARRRPKQCRKKDKSVSSGYPTWKDENMSQESRKKGYKLKPTRNDIGLLEMSAMEKIESYLADVQRYGGRHSDDESDMD